MKEITRSILKKFGIVRAPYNKSYSQIGEDMVLAYFLTKKDGFYVDVGAYHPTLLSNTYFFYKKGWTGINIDPNPTAKEKFDIIRPRDVNLQLAVSDKKGEATYNIFDADVVNTIDPEEVKEKEKYNKIIKKLEVKTDTLENILDQYCHKPIDFISIDVEGHELNVLKSNNWNKYKPAIILLENHDFNIENWQNDQIHLFMKERGYNLFSKIGMTLFYKLNKQVT